jgi:hypothetical protein
MQLARRRLDQTAAGLGVARIDRDAEHRHLELFGIWHGPGQVAPQVSCSSTCLPIALSITSAKPLTQALTSIGRGSSRLLRATASSWPVSFAPRSAGSRALGR